MSGPSEVELAELVKGMRVALQTRDEDAANNAAAIALAISDDRPTWPAISVPRVEAILCSIRAGEVPAYVAPEELFGQEELFNLPPVPGEELTYKLLLDYHPVGIHHAQGGLGSKGAYIIAMEGNEGGALRLVVLKETHMASPSEVFASLVYRQMGLVAPRFLPLTPKQFKEFTWQLRQARVTVPDTCGALHSEAVQEMGGMLMEFVPGKPLPDCQALPSKDQQEVFLRDLGRMLAVDVVLNCLDRTNIVWSHEGNATNLMITYSPTGRVGAIDNTYNRISDPDFQQKHVDKARACASAARRGAANNEYMDQVAGFFSKSTQGRITLDRQQQRDCVVAALREANEELVRTHVAVFEKCRLETQRMFERSWGAGRRDAIAQCLQLDFCTRCVMATQE